MGQWKNEDSAVYVSKWRSGVREGEGKGGEYVYKRAIRDPCVDRNVSQLHCVSIDILVRQDVGKVNTGALYFSLELHVNLQLYQNKA